MKYRKNPIIIEAIKYNSYNLKEVRKFCNKIEYNLNRRKMYIPTLEGIMEVKEGDQIIKGVKGEFYPCKADIFEKTYERI